MQTKLTKRCPYCRSEQEVIKMSARTIPDYKNLLNGKNTAIIETLACQHSFIDGRFDTNSLYGTSEPPKQKEPQEHHPEVIQPKPEVHNNDVAKIEYVHIYHHYDHEKDVRVPKKGSGGLNMMDVMCMIGTVVIAITAPVLLVFPLGYLILRLLTR